LKYLKIPLSSIVVSRLSDSLPKDSLVSIVAAELTLVVSAALSSRDVILRGNIRPRCYKQ
jgi:hypothetical protein